MYAIKNRVMRQLWLFLSLVLFQPAIAQNNNEFTFPELDAKIISIWLGAYQEDGFEVTQRFVATDDMWQLIREEILEGDLYHFNAEPFLLVQDMLIFEMQVAIDNDDYLGLSELSYEFLAGFRDVRKFFTNDLYPLDELFSAFDIYGELHYAVDDPLLGLYEWPEFVRLLDDFEKQFQKYSVVAEPGFDNEGHVLFKLMTQRVRDCSSEFRESLKTAMQNKFVAPCDDTHDALVELIELYAEPPAALQ